MKLGEPIDWKAEHAKVAADLAVAKDSLAITISTAANRIRALEAAAEKVHGIIAEYWGPCMGSVESLLTLREAVGERARTWGPKVSDLPRVTPLETASEQRGHHPKGGPCVHVWVLTNRDAVENGRCGICGQSVANRGTVKNG